MLDKIKVPGQGWQNQNNNNVIRMHPAASRRTNKYAGAFVIHKPSLFQSGVGKVFYQVLLQSWESAIKQPRSWWTNGQTSWHYHKQMKCFFYGHIYFYGWLICYTANQQLEMHASMLSVSVSAQSCECAVLCNGSYNSTCVFVQYVCTCMCLCVQYIQYVCPWCYRKQAQSTV